ncbi:hypothetical protein GTPT_2266 [Tatumella ptyseos ATCC 33301]|uniref:Uncharacterized protein n=1 Tax=Tatumella ptyseos ATCC 33301 TaxID=1005995 RepID=A0A085JER9_9GAMM|nr:hypothetical protein GTPT_2266 [Tatumella ptyseos ATCC 33301]
MPAWKNVSGNNCRGQIFMCMVQTFSRILAGSDNRLTDADNVISPVSVTA